MKNKSIFGFSRALKLMKEGQKVTRSGWNGAGQFVALYKPHGHMTLPYFYISTVTADRVPWLASQTDLLAEDWEVYSPYPKFSTSDSSMTLKKVSNVNLR